MRSSDFWGPADDRLIADVVQHGLQQWWAPLLAFAAGVVSCASPCVLPLVPGYVAFVSGGQAPGADRREATMPILLFILGFTLVFTFVFGFAASSIGRWLRLPAGQRVTGGVVVAFGLFMILNALRIRLPWLYREERPLLSRVHPGTAGALPLGMAFAAGWTPCIGPVLRGRAYAGREPGLDGQDPPTSVHLLAWVGASHLLARDGNAVGYGRIAVHQSQLSLDRGVRRRHDDHDRSPADQRPVGAPSRSPPSPRQQVYAADLRLPALALFEVYPQPCRDAGWPSAEIGRASCRERV